MYKGYIEMEFNRSVMLDGSRVGTELQNSSVGSGNTNIKLSESEASVLENVLKKLDADRSGKDWRFTIRKNGTFMMLMLRTDARDSERRYLNLSGNTLTFLTGGNVVGNPDPLMQLKKCWEICLDRMEKESGISIPKSLRNRVENEEFMIHSLEFAGYTKRLDDVDAVLNVLHGVFHLTYKAKARRGLRTLASRLGCQWVDSEYENSFRLKVNEVSRNRDHTLYFFGMYDKTQEVVANGREVTSNQLEFIEDRLRIDLSFQYRWFSQHRIRTANELRDWVDSRHEGSWVVFLRHELEVVLGRTFIREILDMDGKEISSLLKILEKRDEFVEWKNKRFETSLIKDILFARIFMELTEKERDVLLFDDKVTLKKLVHRVQSLGVGSALGLVNKKVLEK